MCNQYKSSDYKNINYLHKNKICNYCKRKVHFQKICYKKKCDDKINSIIINKEDDSDYVFINTFITSEESHKNQLTKYDLGRICLLQESHYTSIIIIDLEITCHAFYDRIMFKLIKLTIQNIFAINKSLLNV